MTHEEQLEKQCDIASARMGMAEDLGWPIAILAGLIVQMRFDSWLFGIVVGVAVYVLVTHWYKKAYAAANDAYAKATNAGKYMKAPTSNDAV